MWIGGGGGKGGEKRKGGVIRDRGVRCVIRSVMKEGLFGFVEGIMNGG